MLFQTKKTSEEMGYSIRLSRSNGVGPSLWLVRCAKP